jgi:hypothetical protein
MEHFLVTNGDWITPGSVYFYRCPSCDGRRVSYTTRQPHRHIPLDDKGESPIISGHVLYVASSWSSRSGLTWYKPGNPHWSHWWPVSGYHRGQAFGVLLKDPRFLCVPTSLAFTAGEYEVLLSTFKDRPSLRALKGDGPFETRTVWSAVGPDKEIGQSLCLSCLHKEVEAAASHRQGHLTLAPLASLSEAAKEAVSWLSDREPSDPGVFNHGIRGALVHTHSGRVALIDSPVDGDAVISSPDHPDEEIVLSVGGGPWVAVHPWPQKGVD